MHKQLITLIITVLINLGLFIFNLLNLLKLQDSILNEDEKKKKKIGLIIGLTLSIIFFTKLNYDIYKNKHLLIHDKLYTGFNILNYSAFIGSIISLSMSIDYVK
jgi:hypothetical protein